MCLIHVIYISTIIVSLSQCFMYQLVIDANDNDNDNDNANDNEIDLFRHHNGNNTNIKVIFKQVTMLDKCNCI